VSRHDPDRLHDVKAAIIAIKQHQASPWVEPDGPNAKLLHDALLFQLIVIGEAVKNMSAGLKNREPDIPWAKIAGQRDFIAHAYFRVSMERILKTISKDLPPLENAIDRLLALGLPELDDIDEGAEIRFESPDDAGQGPRLTD